MVTDQRVRELVDLGLARPAHQLCPEGFVEGVEGAALVEPGGGRDGVEAEGSGTARSGGEQGSGAARGPFEALGMPGWLRRAETLEQELQRSDVTSPAGSGLASPRSSSSSPRPSSRPKSGA